MLDIFISYKSERRAAASYLASVLEAYGFRVWWDYDLVAGEDFQRRISENIRETRIVLVLWCELAARSDGVTQEASLAKREGNYFPVTIEPVELGFGHANDHLLNLSRWNGSPDAKPVRNLVAQLSKKIGPRPVSASTLKQLKSFWLELGQMSLAQFPKSSQHFKELLDYKGDNSSISKRVFPDSSDIADETSISPKSGRPKYQFGTEAMFVGISGGKASGKSTLAFALAQHVGHENVSIIELDQYYKTRSQLNAKSMSTIEFESIVNLSDPQFTDFSLLLRNMRGLRRGQSVETPRFDFAVMDRDPTATTTIQSKPVIILEGENLLSDSGVRSMLNLSIFIDAPSDDLIARQILRDTAPSSEGGRGRSLNRVLSSHYLVGRPSYRKHIEPTKYWADLILVNDTVADSPMMMTPSQLHRHLAQIMVMLDQVR